MAVLKRKYRVALQVKSSLCEEEEKEQKTGFLIFIYFRALSIASYNLFIF